MYEILSSFAQVGGTVYFAILFAIVLVYALWPKNKAKFDQAAQIPLSDKEPGDE